MVDRIASDAARLAWDKGSKLVVLPAIPFGVNTGQMDIRLNINMNPSTQLAILDDITDVLNRHGIFRFLILNGHGGNDFRQMIRELGLKYPKMFICTCNCLMQYIAPELTLPLDDAGRGDGKKFRLNAFNEGWAWAERKWTQVTSDTGIGNPYLATPEKGRQCFDEVVRKIGNMMFGLSKADINDMYE
jgi:creatinine amidohydrolase